MYISNNNSPCPPHVRAIDLSTHYIDTVQLKTTVRGRHRVKKRRRCGVGRGKGSIIRKITGNNMLQCWYLPSNTTSKISGVFIVYPAT
jgi:hypothetical protein